MAAFVLDTFTDTATTALGSHTGEVGATWTKSTTFNAGGAEISNANRSRSNNANVVIYNASGTPASANYSVATKLTFKSLVNPGYAGLVSRSDGNIGFYMANYDGADSKWHLYSFDPSTLVTEIGGTGVAQSLSAGVDYWVVLKVSGTTISLYVDGVLKITGTSSTMAAAGKAGLIYYKATIDTTGLHHDTFLGGAFAMSANVVSLTPGSTGNSIVLTGTDTRWSTTTPTIAISSTGSGAAITGQSIDNDTQITLTVDAGTTGVITFTDPQTAATATSSVGSRYNMTLVGSPTVSSTATSFSSTNNAANFGNCLSLNGTSQYGTVDPSAFQFAAAQSWTYPFRFRSTSAVGLQVIAGLGGALSGAGGGWWIGVNAGVLVASIQGFNSATPFGTASVSDSAWHDCELVVTTGISATLYVDGVAAGTQTGQYVGFNTDLNLNASVGAYNDQHVTYGFFFQGQIDTSGVFDIARHASGFTPSTTPLSNSASGIRAIWHFDSNSFDTAVPPAPTTATLTGPTTGPTGTNSTAFTVALDTPATQVVTITPAGTNGSNTFTPASPQIAVGQLSVTFTDNAASGGTHVITMTNNRSLTNVGSINYVTSTVKYTRVDATDPVTGQAIMVLVPNGNAAVPYAGAPTNVVLYSHGVGETETALLTDSLKAAAVVALLDAGFILAGTNAHGNNFGSQAAVDDYAALDKYVRAHYVVNKNAIWAQSMGGLTGLLLLAQDKVRDVVGWLGTYPMCSLNAAYTGTGGADFHLSINTAYGITGAGNSVYANKTYGHDPALMTGISFRNVPMRFYASASDTVVVKATNTNVLQTLVGTSCRESVIVVCTGEHGDASHFQPSDYVAFFGRCFAGVLATAGIPGALGWSSPFDSEFQ